MSNTTTTTEVGAVKVANKHTAKKISKNVYQYRGWYIQKFDNGYLLDEEISGVQWNTYRNREDMDSGSSGDIASTLRDAKGYIDTCVERDLEAIGNKEGTVTKAEFRVIANDNPHLPVRLTQSGGETYYSVRRHENGVVYDLLKHFRPTF